MKSQIKNEDIRKKLLDLLSRREHSKYELVSKLERRVISKEKLIDELHKLSDQNLQSDKRFSESYIRSRYNSGFGPIRIKYDLVSKKVKEEVIEKAFAELEMNWEEKIKKENLKKYGHDHAENMQESSKRIKFFLQRGFEKEMIKKIIDF